MSRLKPLAEGIETHPHTSFNQDFFEMWYQFRIESVDGNNLSRQLDTSKGRPFSKYTPNGEGVFPMHYAPS